MTRSSRISTIMAACVACSSLPLPQQVWAEPWRIETVDLLPRGPFPVLGLALDEQGNPHLTYLQRGALVHAFKSGSTWTTEVVDSLGSSNGAGTPNSGFITSSVSASIAVAGDRVHIVYLGKPPVLKHATRSGASWSIQSVDERASSFARNLSVALDPHGNPRVSYCGYPSCPGCLCSLKYAFFSSGVWHTELIDSTTTGAGRTGGLTSVLAVRSSVPHLVTVTNRAFQYTLRYASRSGNWFLETITEDGGEDPSAALDSNGRPHVVCAVENAIRHAWRVGPGEWLVDEFHESAEPTWSLVAMAVDAQDDVHIVHCYEDGVRYLVRKKSGDWDAETVDEQAHGGGFPFNRIALVLDAGGSPHIAYVGSDELLPGNFFLRYAHRE